MDLKNVIKDNKSIALLAPSFPIDFPYPAIIGMLRELGFDQVTEVTFGARMVNWQYAEYIKKNPDQKYFIASPCPTIVVYIQTAYPELVQYLIPVNSPMTAMAKIYKKHHPDHKIVFISPCFAKQKIEAPKYKKYIDSVITFSELKQMFDEKGIVASNFNREYFFDSLIREFTKIFPVSGGLAATSHIAKYFKPEEIFIADGIDNIKPVLGDIKNDKSKYRFLDILNCPGGCIGGPAIINKGLPTDAREKIVQDYKEKSSDHNLGEHEGKVEYAENIDITAKF